MRGRALAGGVAVALVMLALRGLAQNPGIPLADAVKVEPGKCIEAAPLVERIKTWLKRDSIDPRLRVEVRASKTANDVHFTIRRAEQIVGEKDMRAEMACPEFQSAVALAIASALDAIILETEREQDAAPDVVEEPIVDAAPPEDAPAIVPDASPDARPPQPETTRFLFSLETGLSATHLPVATLFVSPGLDLRIVRWFDARVAFAFTPEVTILNDPHVVMQLVFVEAQGCWVWLQAPLRARACAGLAVGAIPYHRDVPAVLPAMTPTQVADTTRWGAIPLRVDARWPANGLLAFIGAISVDPVLVPPTLVFGAVSDPKAPTIQTPWVGFSILGGFQVRVF